jgi:hypothetical protein
VADWVTGTLTLAGEPASGTNVHAAGAANATIVPVSPAARIALDLELPRFSGRNVCRTERTTGTAAGNPRRMAIFALLGERVILLPVSGVFRRNGCWHGGE